MKLDGRTLWAAFREAMIASIKETDFSSFETAWKSCDNRTEFYFTELLPKIAARLDLGFRKERPFRTDGIFWKKGGQTTEVPIIYVESENIATTSDSEVYKLCCINAPLKVLILCTPWGDPLWKKELSEGYWHYIIDDFNDEVGLTGYFAIIIAAWDKSLKFHSYVLDEEAELIEDNLLTEI
jgi:hypothetical protein